MHCFFFKIYAQLCFCFILVLGLGDPTLKVAKLARRVKFGINKGLGVKTNHEKLAVSIANEFDTFQNALFSKFRG